MPFIITNGALIFSGSEVLPGSERLAIEPGVGGGSVAKKIDSTSNYFTRVPHLPGSPGRDVVAACGSASYFAEQPEAQRGKATCPRSCIQLMAEPKWEPGSLTPNSPLLLVRGLQSADWACLFPHPWFWVVLWRCTGKLKTPFNMKSYSTTWYCPSPSWKRKY